MKTLIKLQLFLISLVICSCSDNFENTESNQIETTQTFGLESDNSDFEISIDAIHTLFNDNGKYLEFESMNEVNNFEKIFYSFTKEQKSSFIKSLRTEIPHLVNQLNNDNDSGLLGSEFDPVLNKDNKVLISGTFLFFKENQLLASETYNGFESGDFNNMNYEILETLNTTNVANEKQVLGVWSGNRTWLIWLNGLSINQEFSGRILITRYHDIRTCGFSPFGCNRFNYSFLLTGNSTIPRVSSTGFNIPQQTSNVGGIRGDALYRFNNRSFRLGGQARFVNNSSATFMDRDIHIANSKFLPVSHSGTNMSGFPADTGTPAIPFSF